MAEGTTAPANARYDTLNAFAAGNPHMGQICGISLGRGFRTLKGLSGVEEGKKKSDREKTHEKKQNIYLPCDATTNTSTAVAPYPTLLITQCPH